MDEHLKNQEINSNDEVSQSQASNEDKARWYVVHTYSGHENKVKATMEALVINSNMQDYIFDIQVPMEEYVENRDGVKKVKERKIFPSYVLVKMIMNDESWYIVRNTRGVTGFVGPGSKPVPLTEEEVKNLGVASNKELFDGYEIGDNIKVINGPFNKFSGVIESFNYEKGIEKVIK